MNPNSVRLQTVQAGAAGQALFAKMSRPGPGSREKSDLVGRKQALQRDQP